MPRAKRTATREIRVMVDDATFDLLQETAKRRREPVAAIVRKAIDRMLRRQAADDGAQVLAEAVRGVLREELAGTRRLAFLAAFEAARAGELMRRFHRQEVTIRLAGTKPGGVTPALREQVASSIAREDAEARRWAAQRTRDPEPADPADEAPPAPLPTEESDAIGAD